MKKQFIAKLLVLAMVLSMVTVTAFATNAAGSRAGSAGGSNGSGSSSYTPPVDTTVRVDDPVSEDGTIEATVVNGTAKVALSDKAVESLADLAEDGEITLELSLIHI